MEIRLNKKKIILTSFYLIAFISYQLAAGVSAEVRQTDSSPQVVAVKPLAPSSPVTPGETFELTLELTIPPNFHINSNKPEDKMLIPTSIEFKKAPAFEVKEIIFPEAKKKKFMFSESPLSSYEGQIKVKIKITLDKNYQAKNLLLEGKVHYQPCNDYACIRPESVPFRVNIAVTTN